MDLQATSAEPSAPEGVEKQCVRVRVWIEILVIVICFFILLAQVQSRAFLIRSSFCTLVLSCAMPPLSYWQQQWVHLTRLLLGVVAPTHRCGRSCKAEDLSSENSADEHGHKNTAILQPVQRRQHANWRNSKEKTCYLCTDPFRTSTTEPFFHHPDLKEIYMHATCFCAFAAWHETQENLRETLLVWHKEVILQRSSRNVLVLEIVQRWQRVNRCKWICTLRLQHLCRPLLVHWHIFTIEARDETSSSSSLPPLLSSSSSD